MVDRPQNKLQDHDACHPADLEGLRRFIEDERWDDTNRQLRKIEVLIAIFAFILLALPVIVSTHEKNEIRSCYKQSKSEIDFTNFDNSTFQEKREALDFLFSDCMAENGLRP